MSGADEVGFILRLARALHSWGYAAHRLEEVLSVTAGRLSVDARFSATPTSVLVSVGSGTAERLHLIRGEPGEVDLGRLTELAAVTREVHAGTLTPAGGSARLQEIAAKAPPYGPLVTTLAFGLLSAAAARFLGGGVRELAVAAVIGLAVGLMALPLNKVPAARMVYEPAAGLVASSLAAAAALLLGGLSVFVATVAGLIILMPGFQITVGMTELSSRHLVSGTARLAGAFVTLIAIAFGVAIGARLAAATFGEPPVVPPAALPAWTEGLALVVAPLAFTVLLRARPRDAIWILLAGALAFGGGRLGAFALGPELGAFVAALIVGLASNAYARLLRRPAAVTLVPGILLLVPGSVGFRSLTSLLDREVVLGVETAFKMVLMAVALAAGILVANAIAPSRAAV
jgi:uncharacterized membrane protein YjjP (DUF1212 family)